jgi:hypothetical protein
VGCPGVDIRDEAYIHGVARQQLQAGISKTELYVAVHQLHIRLIPYRSARERYAYTTEHDVRVKRDTGAVEQTNPDPVKLKG